MNSSHRDDLLNEVELLDPPGGDKLRCRFHGPFEGRAVQWAATLYTPSGWAVEYGVDEPRHNIIEVAGEGEGEILLAICLQVSHIDRPTVRKAVMMTRQYRRLRRGRHVYG